MFNDVKYQKMYTIVEIVISKELVFLPNISFEKESFKRASLFTVLWRKAIWKYHNMVNYQNPYHGELSRDWNLKVTVVVPESVWRAWSKISSVFYFGNRKEGIKPNSRKWTCASVHICWRLAFLWPQHTVWSEKVGLLIIKSRYKVVSNIVHWRVPIPSSILHPTCSTMKGNGNSK